MRFPGKVAAYTLQTSDLRWWSWLAVAAPQLESVPWWGKNILRWAKMY